MKKRLIILLIILFIGAGYVVYDTMQDNKEKETNLTDLQSQIDELNAQLSGEQLTGAIDEPIVEIIPEPVEDIVAPVQTPAVSITSLETVENNVNTSVQTSSTSYSQPQFILWDSRWPQKNICWYRDNEWLPTKQWGADAKFINSKLQYLWDNWQQHTESVREESYRLLSDANISLSEKCRYSWLIDEMTNQKWYIESYQTQNWITTIGIDFISLQEDISKTIQYEGFPSLKLYKNTSTKARYYTLSSDPTLMSLYTDANWFIEYQETGSLRNIEISNFNTWINQFCNNEPIYNHDDGNSINFNYFNGVNNDQCMQSKINNGSEFIFTFSPDGKLNSIQGWWRRFWIVTNAW